MRQVLEGLKVLDFTNYLPGPYCTQVLVELGAEVLKVENPRGGDPCRSFMASGGGTSPWFEAVNRGKRSVAVDLKHPRGREVVLGLARAGWDIWVEGFRPGVMQRLGLGYEEVSKQLPGLIYVSISGFGQQGPMATRPGHDANYLALSGLMYVSAHPQSGPGLWSLPVADLAGGALPALAGLLAAVIGRERTGRGAWVDVGMWVSLMHLGRFPLAGIRAGVESAEPGGTGLVGRYPCYSVYRTRDGRYVVLGALEEKFWRAFVEGVGREELMDLQYDPSPEAKRKVAEVVEERDFDWWVDFAAKNECCLEPVLSPHEAWERAAGAGDVLVGGIGRKVQGPAPGLGEDTREVLQAAGFSQEELEQLASEGVVGLGG